MVNRKQNNKSQRKPISRQRRGVGVIIGGAMLVAIVFTTVAIYFLTVMQSDEIRSKSELQAMQFKNDKALEDLTFESNPLLLGATPATQGEIQFFLNNTGPIPVRASYMFFYHTSSGSPVIPETITSPIPSGGLTINDGEVMLLNLTGYTAFATETYRADIVTERGNVFSATWPPPPKPLTPQQIGTIVNNTATAIVAQGLGSISLDFKSMGVIFPNYVGMGGVEQTGWSVFMNSNQHGYPAFRVPSGSSDSSSVAYLIIRVKNVDQSGRDMVLNYDTGLIISITNDQGQQQAQSVFLCKENFATHTVSQYDESNINTSIVLPNAFGVTGEDKWVNLVFCDRDMSKTNFSPDFKPATASINMSPVFMIYRATFVGTNENYGQTIPFQAITLTSPAQQQGQPNNAAIIACLKSDGNSDCTSNSNNKYSESVSTMASGGGEVFVRLSGSGDTNHPVAAPYDVDWIYPDGTYLRLATALAAKDVSYHLTNLPSKMSDGVTDIVSGDYIIKITDSKSNVFLMTFKVGSLPPNQAPVATSQSNICAVVAGTTSITLSGTDPDNDPVTGFEVVTQPTKGTLSGSGANLIYTANAGVSGSDSFTFKVQDSRGAWSTSDGTVTLALDHNPVANPDVAVTTSGNSVIISVKANDVDSDSDPMTITSVTQPTKGSVTINGGNTVTYTASNGGPSKGIFTFTYTISDGKCGTATGTVTVTVA